MQSKWKVYNSRNIFFCNFVIIKSLGMNIYGQGKEKIQEDFDVDVLELASATSRLVVWNDDVNTFDWVIDSLVDICDHTVEQATQCAYIVHYNGKSEAKKGDYDTLEPMCTALLDRGISATID